MGQGMANVEEVAGDVAHDAADSGNPIKIGGKATQLNPAAVTEGDRTQASFDLDGYMRVRELRSASMSQSLGLLDDVVAAHDVSDSGSKSIKVGHKAVGHVAQTAVAAGDRVDSIANRDGVVFTIGGHPNVETLTGDYNTAQTATVLKSVSSGKFVITSYEVLSSKDTTVNVAAEIKLGSSRVTKHFGIAPGSGHIRGNGGGILAVGGDGDNLTFTCGVATSGRISVSVTGFLIDS
jgi:hypothetical protein